MNKKEENIIRFADAGFRLCKLGHRNGPNDPTDFMVHGKIPGLGFTKTRFINPIDPKKFPANYGVVLEKTHLVVDVDPRNFPEGYDSFAELQNEIGVDLTKAAGFYVKTGGGGFHYYFKKPADWLVRNELKDRFPGIEFKSVGRQVVGPGSIHPDTFRRYSLVGNPDDLRPAPQELLDLIRREDLTLKKGLDSYDDSDGNIASVRSVLREHPAAVAGQGGNTTTYQAACLCKENGVSENVAFDLLREYNDRCNPPWSQQELMRLVGNAYRYGQNAAGSKNPKNDFDVVESVNENPSGATSKKPVSAAPEFLDDIEQNWVYCIGTKEFFYLPKMRAYDKEQFDDVHSGKTDKKKPSAFAIGYPAMQKVTLPTYWPGQPRIIEEDGELKVNLYSKPKIEAEPGDISTFMEFVDYLAGGKAWIIHDFMAYILRNPGEKVLWGILLQGDYGVGKSLLARTFVQLLGYRNVSQPTNQIIHEKYNSWLKACQLVIVHELMAQGRVEMMNKLKDPITEPTIQIREMFKPPYETKNRANFIFLTNFKDSIVVPKGDRRMAIIFSQAEPRAPEYYENFVDWLFGFGPSALLNYYLNEHKFDARFKPKAPAPKTTEKLKMERATLHPVQSAIMDAFDDEEPPFHGRIANLSQIVAYLRQQGFKNTSKIQVSLHLQECGFVPLGDRIRWGSRTEEIGRLWAIRNTDILRGCTVDKLRDLYLKQERDYENNLNSDFSDTKHG